VRRDVEYTHEDFGKAIPCPTCHRKSIADRLKESSQLGGWLKYDARLSSYKVTTQNREAYDYAVKFVSDPTYWLTLWGGYGVGKTHLLAGIVNECTSNEIAAVYYTLPDLLDVLRGFIGEGIYSNRVSQLVNVPVLAVDEVDKARLTEWARETVYELFDARYRALGERGTIFAMNEEPDRDNAEWGYLFSRMWDARNVCVQVGGGDVRPIVDRIGG
jgi:DNA replication protein DnaC